MGIIHSTIMHFNLVLSGQRIKFSLHQNVEEETSRGVVGHLSADVYRPEKRVAERILRIGKGHEINCHMTN